MWLHAESVTVDSDEGRTTLEIVDAESGKKLTVLIHDCDLDTFYDQVKSRIGPYLQEKEAAFAEFRQAVRSGTGPAAAFLCNPDERVGYATDDPKHPDYHDAMSDLWDSRDKTAGI